MQSLLSLPEQCTVVRVAACKPSCHSLASNAFYGLEVPVRVASVCKAIMSTPLYATIVHALGRG